MNKLLTTNDVLLLVPVSRTKFFDMIKFFQFPKPCKRLGPRKPLWTEKIVIDWIESKNEKTF